MVYKHAYLNTFTVAAFMLSLVKVPLKEAVGGRALNSHGNYMIVDHGNVFFEYLWEPCLMHLYYRWMRGDIRQRQSS